ncbi:MAG: dephospho-CoA kinase [Candidatus Pelagibacter sp. TMED239]|nr:MAG: dephospho-CoA kinase [Candidatus Pelagibacter sp. TMED239]
MIRIGILGDIGSGKSYIAKEFGYPVFNADEEVGKLYKKNKKILKKFKRVLPGYFNSLPINKKYVSQAILDNKNNLKKIIKIVHVEIKKKMNFFLKKNKRKKFVILDIPLLLENNINNKNDILVFVQTKKSDVLKKLKMRKNFNKKLMNHFNKIQLPLDYKKKKSQFIIKNDFKKKTVLKYIKNILQEID